MKHIPLHQTDAFTDTLFCGNPAGVAFDADSLSTTEMENIAREMNLSETAFVLKPTADNADCKLRYFTSGKAEIKFCGHATVAALYEMGRAGEYGMAEPGTYALKIETNAGVLPMSVIKKSAADITVQFSAPNVQLEEYANDLSAFAKRLGIPPAALDQTKPVMIDRNLNYIYMAASSLKALGDLDFSFQHIIDTFREENIVVFCLLVAETVDAANTVHMRGLAPLVGVPEDPFTGSAQAGMATYARQNAMVDQSLHTLKVEQGHFIGRPGCAAIAVPRTANDPYLITGQAVHVFSTTITL